ncbi:PhzF family phenazine biosynthesis protein [Sporosalibacterium faouarense]|uniref:PhzF family phenazine biosynthesis protein n=1 Tax=Sporosalibacterium faouarense TaxID=516123 RepID=UPI00141C9674|nr:PhzF family phenazine biosynthesis protein [Sporosalibacterium faouarense]MTI49803.1 PhzF family phenazine biosynthesis protein [Bacillota bacterium]
MDVIIYQVDAFTDKPFGGNPAGVVPDARGLSENDMQNIAMEMNLSETAFVIAKDPMNFDIRFFTPKCEVDLCGHATIATFYTLAYKGYIEGIENGVVKVYQNTKLGKLPVEIYYSGGAVESILMHQDKPRFLGAIEDINSICESLNISREQLGIENNDLDCQIISTGLADIMIPVKNKEILMNLNINYDKVSKLSRDNESIGIHVFAIEDESKIWCRNFAPLVGINEEAATGTANGALLYYLKRNNILKENKIRVYQGYSLGRPSIIDCEFEERNSDKIIKVGGKASIVIEGVINI